MTWLLNGLKGLVSKAKGMQSNDLPQSKDLPSSNESPSRPPHPKRRDMKPSPGRFNSPQQMPSDEKRPPPGHTMAFDPSKAASLSPDDISFDDISFDDLKVEANKAVAAAKLSHQSAASNRQSSSSTAGAQPSFSEASVPAKRASTTPGQVHPFILHEQLKDVDIKKLRTPDEINKERLDKLPQADLGGMPLKPMPTYEESVEAIEVWAREERSNGRGFSVTSGAFSFTNHITKGPTKRLPCECHGKYRAKATNSERQTKTKKTECQWGWNIELSTEGYMPALPIQRALETFRDAGCPHGNFHSIVHNHQLFQTVEEANTSAGMRTLSDKQKDEAEILIRAGFSPSKVYAHLAKECIKKEQDITFSKKDIANLFPDSGDKAFDCSNLLQYLHEQREKDPTRSFDYKLDKDGSLDCVFVTMKGAVERWAESENAVLLYDTKFGTNRYGMKLGCLVYMDGDGCTHILAITLIRSEDESSFDWVFRRFSALFGTQPAVVFTDSDKAMAAAILKAWPNAVHLLCTFHLFKNFYENIHPLFAGKNDEWHFVANWWWRLCKHSDVLAQQSFGSDWQALSDYVLSIAKQNNATEKSLCKAQKWLKEMGDRSTQWAACYTWGSLTFGIHSTQRCEAINSAVALFSRKTSTVVDLIGELETLSTCQQLNADSNALVNQFKSRVAPPGHTSVSIFPPAEALAESMEDHPRQILLAQSAQLVLYHCYAKEDVIQDPSSFGLSDVDDLEAFLAEHGLDNAEVFLVSIMDSVFEAGDDFHGHDSGRQKDARRAADFGLQEAPVAMLGSAGSRRKPLHWATVDHCTCQFSKCFGKIPCRHRLCVMHRTNWKGSIEAHPFWLKRSRADRKARSKSGSVIQRAADVPISGNQLTRSQQLDAAWGPLREVAARTPAATKRVLAGIAQMISNEANARSSAGAASTTAVPLAANPPTVKNQNQRRRQPGQIGAPTSKGAKKAA